MGGGLGARKAIYVPFGNAVPQVALLDLEHCLLCGRCEKACPAGAIDYLQEPETVEIDAGWPGPAAEPVGKRRDAARAAR